MNSTINKIITAISTMTGLQDISKHFFRAYHHYEFKELKDVSDRLISNPTNMLLLNFIHIINNMNKTTLNPRINTIIINTYDSVMKANNVDLDLKAQLRIALILKNNSYTA